MDRRYNANWVFLLTALFALPPALGQAGIEVSQPPDSVMAGEKFTITVKVPFSREATDPQTPDPPGLLIELAGTRYLRINRTQYRQYTYAVAPIVPGTFEFPALDLTVDGRPVRTDPVPFRVTPNELATATVTTEAKRLFVGQRATFTLRLKLAAPGRRTSPMNWNDTAQLLERDRSYPQLRYTGATREETSDGLRTFYSYEAQFQMDLREPGPPPVRSVLATYVFSETLGRDVFGTIRPIEPRVFIVTPHPNTPDVEALPTDGRPDSFTGAVGQFDIRASASPRRVSEGEPITLRIEITGDGPLDLLPAPDLNMQAALTERFRVPTEPLAGETDGAARRYSQSIRPRDARVTEIPPIEFGYFDPQAAEYRVASSRPVKIEVAAADRFDVSGMKITLPTDADLDTLDGLRGPRVDETELMSSQTEITPAHVALGAAIPPGLFVVAWLALSGRGAGGGAALRRRSALSAANRRLNELRSGAEHHHARELAAIIAGYLGDRLNEPAGRFVGDAALDGVRRCGGSSELADRFQRLLARCEASAFGGAETEAALIEEARDAIRALEARRP